MDDESTQLTDRERRVLAEMELALRRDSPDLERSFRRRTWRRTRAVRPAVPRWMWWVTVVLGTGLLAAGLVLGAVAVGLAGFVAVLVAVHELSSDLDGGRAGGRLRRWFGLDERDPGQ
jgi:hypothetical protein